MGFTGCPAFGPPPAEPPERAALRAALRAVAAYRSELGRWSGRLGALAGLDEVGESECSPALLALVGGRGAASLEASGVVDLADRVSTLVVPAPGAEGLSLRLPAAPASGRLREACALLDLSGSAGALSVELAPRDAGGASVAYYARSPRPSFAPGALHFAYFLEFAPARVLVSASPVVEWGAAT